VADKSTMSFQIEPHHDRQTFIARGIASGEAARKSGTYISVDAVLKKLAKRLNQARTNKPKAAKLI
jgi:hypothetical protein